MWIPEYLTKNKTESSSDQTLYVDLPEKEQISFLQLDLSVTNATNLLTRTIMDPIDKIEVIADGVKTLYNLEPEIASYIQFVTQNGQYPNHNFNYVNAQRQTLELIIPFGRHLFDEEYMLDTGLYDSVQLRIPYTLDTSYETAASFRHSIVMWRPLEKLAPVGFIRSRAIEKETLATSAATINHKLPMTYPWRFLGARLNNEDQNIATTMDEIKLNVDEGRLIPFDLRINELRDLDKIRFPRTGFYRILSSSVTEEYFRAHVDNPWPDSIVSSAAVGLMYRPYHAIGDRLALTFYHVDGSTPTETFAIINVVSGVNPHQCLGLWDGRKEPFPADTLTQAKVEYSHAAYATELTTFIQEVVLGKLS